MASAEDERDVEVLLRPPIPLPPAPGARTDAIDADPIWQNCRKVTAQCKAIVDGVERVFEAVVELPAGLWNASFNKD